MIQISDPLQITGALALLVGTVYFLVKVFAVKYLDSKIDAKFATELETHKHELQKEAKHKEIQFLKLRERQMVVFEEFYEKLVGTYNCLVAYADFVEYDNDLDGRDKKLIAAYNEFSIYYHNKRIFFNDKICTDTDELLKKVRKARSDRKLSNTKGIPLDKQDEYWNQSFKLVETDCQNLKIEVEKTFRSIMGV